MGEIESGNGVIGCGVDKQALDQPAQLAERSLPALHQFISNNQATIIDYHRFQQAGYYIGSAVVEKAVDLLVCRR